MDKDIKEVDLTIEQLKAELINKRAELLFHDVSKTTGKVIIPSLQKDGNTTATAIIIMTDITPEQIEEKTKALLGQIDIIEWNIRYKQDKKREKNRKTYYKEEKKVRDAKKNTLPDDSLE